MSLRCLALLLSFILMAGCAQQAARTTTAPIPAPSRAVAAPDARAIDAEVARILGGQHSPMPPVQHVQRDAGSQVAVINAKNDTAYRLTLLYSGATSQRLALAPRESGTVRIQAGDYVVAASVEGSGNIRPFAGRQKDEGGRYEVSWFIVTRPAP
jgi:hypothetical protein